MSAYYNEIDPRAAAWLRELIARGHIAPGIVDERSIRDIRATDLVGYTQCHFFAGIGVWSAALRGAGWSDDRPVWTGSCPCQPFSSAGRGEGFDDDRHLWPEFHRLIAERRPPVVFGEQVASKDGLQWLDLVHADLEASGYAVGAVDLSAAGIGAPHIRQRLYWVADAHEDGRSGLAPSRLHERRDGAIRHQSAEGNANGSFGDGLARRGESGSVEYAELTGLEGHTGHGDDGHEPGRFGALTSGSVAETGAANGVVDTDDARREGHGLQSLLLGGNREGTLAGVAGLGAAHGERPGPTNGHWRAADWLLCRDGKWRAVEPGTFPLAHGAEARVGRLRGYGNAICLPLAQTFIEAYREAKGELG